MIFVGDLFDLPLSPKAKEYVHIDPTQGLAETYYPKEVETAGEAIQLITPPFTSTKQTKNRSWKDYEERKKNRRLGLGKVGALSNSSSSSSSDSALSITPPISSSIPINRSDSFGGMMLNDSFTSDNTLHGNISFEF